MGPLLRRLLTPVAGATLGVLAVAAFQSRFIYFPSREVRRTPADAGLAFEDVWLTATDGVRTHGWWVPAENARGTVLFFHGNAGNLGDRIETIEIFARLGLDTLAVDYRGFGNSEGTPGENGTYDDADAAYEYLIGERGVDPSRLVLMGRSLGGGVATSLAVERAHGALVLESTFTSVPDMAAHALPFLPARWLTYILYDNLARIPEIRSPLLVVHSPDDEIVPYEHGRRLFEAANEPKTFLEISGDHGGGFYYSGATYTDGFSAFLDGAIGPQT